MTFDEAWKQIKELSFPIQVPDEADDAEVWMSDLIDVFEELRQEYAPTVEMTKKQYSTFKCHKDNLDFSACLGTFQNYNGETRMGIKFDNLKGDLSDEDIMQAWLHPETIKIVDE